MSNHIIVTSHHMFTQLVGYLGRYGRRALRSGIRAWFTSRTRRAVCVFHAFMLFACVLIILVVCMLIS